MHLSALVLLIAQADPTPAGAQDSTAGSIRGRLEPEIPRLMELARVPGLAVALVEHEDVAWSAGFGRRSAGAEPAVGDETVFAAASLSKPVFAYAVLKLVDEGLIDLDRRLIDYAALDDLAHDPRHEQLTARMVLSHTTGLPNWRPQGRRLEFTADPGTRWGYSGEGFVLLQRVVERLTGSTLEALAQELVFEPLGMEHASFLPPREPADLARPHDELGHPLQVREPPGSRLNAAASLCCTAGDYGRFLAALVRGEGLSESSRRALVTPQIQVGPGIAWGLGWGLEEHADGYALWQWGHNDGYRAFAIVYPGRGSAFLFLSNGEGGMLILRDLLRLGTGEDEHPALAHLHYESHDSPRRIARLAIQEALDGGTVEDGIASYFAQRRIQPADVFDEDLLNQIGYRLLYAEDPRRREALELFRLNVELYPESANPHDSLGQAYAESGELERAILCYQRAAALDPGNGGPAQRVEELRAKLVERAR